MQEVTTTPTTDDNSTVTTTVSDSNSTSTTMDTTTGIRNLILHLKTNLKITVKNHTLLFSYFHLLYLVSKVVRTTVELFLIEFHRMYKICRICRTVLLVYLIYIFKKKVE